MRTLARTRRRIAALAALLLAGSTQACFLLASADFKGDGPVETARVYEVVDLTGPGITPYLTLRTVQPIRFTINPNGPDTQNGAMYMQSPCNSFNIVYEVTSKGRMKATEPNITSNPCSSEVAAIEATIAGIMPDLVAWAGPDSALLLRTSDGRRIHLAPVGNRYQLLSADGGALPVTYANIGGTTYTVTNDTLLLRGDGLALFRTRRLVVSQDGASILTDILPADYVRVGTDSIRFSATTRCEFAPCPAVSMSGFRSNAEVRINRFPEGTPVSYRYQTFTPFGM
jgi:hypothetical protein